MLRRCLVTCHALAAGLLLPAGYARGDAHGDDFTVVPACSPKRDLEISLGLTRLRAGAERDTIVDVALKTVFDAVAAG
jgi:hypothetical protein